MNRRVRKDIFLLIRALKAGSYANEAPAKYPEIEVSPVLEKERKKRLF
jgi:hypothetical protein